MNKTCSILFFVSFCFLLWSCASQGQLTGGDKDEQAPVLQEQNSTPNFQTNFYPHKIELIFDEFIQLKNPLKEIGLSPPLKNLPKYQARGKKLTIEFPKDEVLREEATYTINFGNSIQDFRESNVLENFTFVFSTGDVLDSLSLKGSVKNALDGKPIENAVVLLYDNLSDSAVYSEKPFYFDKTDKQGNFIIQNIKNDSFNIYAIIDENLSYTWNSNSEAIAFANESFVLTDSFNTSFDFYMSNPIQEPEVIAVETSKNGLIKCSFTEELKEKPVFAFSKEIIQSSYFFKDSLFIWYDTISNPLFNMYMLNDTFKIKPKGKKKQQFKIDFNKRSNTLQIIPKDTLKVHFDYPILEWEKDSILLIDTSNQMQDFELSQTFDKRVLIFEHDRKFDVPYAIQFRDSSLVSYNKVFNDSLDFKFSYLKEEALGTIHFVHDSIVSNTIMF